jgi:hypothetical protein
VETVTLRNILVSTENVWIDSKKTYLPICALSTFQEHRKKNFPKLMIRKPTKDICGICFKLKIHHKTRNNVLNVDRCREISYDDDNELESPDHNGDSMEVNNEDDNPDNEVQYDNYGHNREHVQRMSHDELDDKEKSLLDAAKHVEEAQSMRELANRKILERRETANKPRSERVVTVCCDYAQNGELPSYGNKQLGETYYFSPLTVIIFGVVNTDKEEDTLTTYCYDEGVGQKGGNNVTSLLMKHFDEMLSFDEHDPITELNILLDNCPGQNKTRMVLRMASYLVELGFYKNVNLIFLCRRTHEKSV